QRLAWHGRAFGAALGRRRPDRDPRRRRRRRGLGPARAAEGGRRVVDHRRARREACPVRRSLGFDDIWPVVTEIVADVRDRGDAAVAEWAQRLGDPVPQRVDVEPQDLEHDVLDALRTLIETVTVVHAAERPEDVTVEPREGVVVERRWQPLDSVGIYVPAGRFPLPSSLVLAAAPARAAGVRRLCVVTPRPVPATIAAAELLGVDEVYAIGGAQAIAALAFGTETIAPGDQLVGPGNRWVTAAKVLVSAHVGVD